MLSQKQKTLLRAKTKCDVTRWSLRSSKIISAIGSPYSLIIKVRDRGAPLSNINLYNLHSSGEPHVFSIFFSKQKRMPSNNGFEVLQPSRVLTTAGMIDRIRQMDSKQFFQIGGTKAQRHRGSSTWGRKGAKPWKHEATICRNSKSVPHHRLPVGMGTWMLSGTWRQWSKKP